MAVYQLDNEIWFPSPDEYDSDIVAVGGDLRAERLLTGYSMGIFPWYNDPGEIIWWCPAERCLLMTDHVHISHSMRNVFNRNEYRFSMDTAFREVMEGCRGGDREGETWILDEMLEAYCHLHELGYAHSVEVWKDNALVGGLYGVSLGHVFFGESMFSRSPNSSKAALIWLSQHLKANGWKMIDCQVHTDHLESLGGEVYGRKEFLALLDVEMKYPTLRGNWAIDHK
jgi:leucyl/phenylalanyl-tRNA---protein transferase